LESIRFFGIGGLLMTLTLFINEIPLWKAV
jgi:hypothetical protein